MSLNLNQKLIYCQVCLHRQRIFPGVKVQISNIKINRKNINITPRQRLRCVSVHQETQVTLSCLFIIFIVSSMEMVLKENKLIIQYFAKTNYINPLCTCTLKYN